MYDYFCPTCKKKIKNQEEIELREYQYEGDYHEYHVECDSKLIVTFKAKELAESSLHQFRY